MPSERPPSRNVFGLLLLDKPLGLSSNRALQSVKRLFRAAKAGHAGSLDPLATGMLPIFFGAATRLAGFLLDARKTYAVVAQLGVATDTGDAEGNVIAERTGGEPPTAAAVGAAMQQFHGDIDQIPPMYSALKRDGVPLYRLARRGLEVERPSRRVAIDELRLDRYEWPVLAFTVRCSKGTYVRTLVEDLAVALGTVGHVRELRRLAVTPFEATQMHTLEALEAAAAASDARLDALLLPPDSALTSLPSVELSVAQATAFGHGQGVAAAPDWPEGLIKVYAQPQGFIAIGDVAAGQLRPQRVFRR